MQALTAVDVYGFCGWIDIKLNSILVMNIIVSFAVTVTYTSHLNRHFLLAQGEHSQRIGRAFQEILPALCYCALTTFASVIALVNSEWI
eukprot:UN07287